MVTMPSPPAWKKDAICTERGWRHPRTNELLVSRGFTEEEVALYNNKLDAPAEPVVEAPLVEVPVEHNATEEILVEVPEETPDLDSMTKKELEELGRSKYGIELDRRNTKSTLIEQMKDVMGI